MKRTNVVRPEDFRHRPDKNWAVRPGAMSSASKTQAGLVRHSQNSEGVDSVGSSYEIPDAHLGHMDISASNFMNAINFDSLAGLHPNGDVSFDEESAAQPNQLGADINLQNDLTKQQEAMEQAKLLHRFKQFREWQQQQQDQLMAQQQQQLLQLRGEQERVQRMMAKHKQMQWSGATEIHDKGPRLSPRRNFTAATSPQRNNSQQNMNGRPAPVLPERPPTPEEYRERGNPNLDSDSATVSSRDARHMEDEDGVCSIADTASESDFPLHPTTAPGTFPAAHHNHAYPSHGHGRNTMNGYLAESTQPGAPSNTQLGYLNPTQQMQMQLLNQLATQSGLAGFPNYLLPNGQVPNGAFSLPALNQQQHISGIHPTVLQNLLLQSLTQETNARSQNSAQPPPTHPNPIEVEEEIILPRSKIKPKSPPRVKQQRLKQSHMDGDHRVPHGVEISDSEGTIHEGSKTELFATEEDNPQETEARYVEEGENENEWEEEENESESEEEEENNTQIPVDEDDRPIDGITAKKKTFEELLEEELQKEEERLKEEDHSQEVSGKRPFLKKGEGLARFNKPIRPRPKRPKSSSASSQAGARAEANKTKVPRSPPSAPDKVSRSKSARIASRPASGKTATQQVQKNATATVTQDVKGPTTSRAPQRQPVPPAEPKKANSRGQLIKNKQVSPKQVGPSPPAVHQTQGQSLGETSFQNRIQVKSEEAECEAEELEEFEILEELADDDVSFVSNVSAVNKVVSQLKETKNGAVQVSVDTRQIHKPRHHQPPGNEKKLLQHLQQRKHKQQQELAALNAKMKLLTSPENVKISESEGFVEDGSNGTGASASELTEANSQEPAKAPPQAKVVPQRKVASLASRPSSIAPGQEVDSEQSDYLQRVIHFSDSGSSVQSEDDKENESSDEDSFVVKNITVHQKSHDTNINWNNNENIAAVNSSDKHGQNNANVSTSVSESSRTTHVLEANPQPTSGMTTNSMSSLPSPRKESTPVELDTHQQGSLQGDGGVIPHSDDFDFGDEEEWGDSSRTEDLSTTLTNGHSPRSTTGSSVTLKKTVIATNTVPTASLLNGHGERETEAVSTTPPPTSKLVSRLFPKLRPEPTNQQKDQQAVQQQKLETAKQSNVADGVQSKVLRDKLLQLETEIERFRSENAALTNLRKEREEGLAKLNKEMMEFENQKEAELKRLNDFKIEETKKLKRERKLFDQYQKAARAIPDKKEREEIENLKKQVLDLQEELKRKEQRWTSSTSRLRDRIESLENENSELKEEVRILERKRLEAWQQREAEKKSTTSNVSHQPLKKEASRTLAPTPVKQTSQFLERENALRLSSNTEEMKTLMSGFSVKETALPSMSRESAGGDNSDLRKNQENSSILPRKALVFNVSNTIDLGDGMYEENMLPDGKVEKLYSNGSREVLFPNGNRKQISCDGQSIIVSFFNGDVKQIMPDQRVVYYYSEVQTTHTTYPDGLEILQFPNNQVEKHYPDGTREISFPDNTIKYLFPSGVEECIFEDGTVLRVEKNGDKTMEFPNGQREVHTQAFMRREYPDGTVKTVYPDGRHETQYSSGRLRIKDKEGNILVDKRTS